MCTTSRFHVLQLPVCLRAAAALVLRVGGWCGTGTGAGTGTGTGARTGAAVYTSTLALTDTLQELDVGVGSGNGGSKKLVRGEHVRWAGRESS